VFPIWECASWPLNPRSASRNLIPQKNIVDTSATATLRPKSHFSFSCLKKKKKKEEEEEEVREKKRKRKKEEKEKKKQGKGEILERISKEKYARSRSR